MSRSRAIRKFSVDEKLTKKIPEIIFQRKTETTRKGVFVNVQEFIVDVKPYLKNTSLKCLKTRNSI